MLPFVLIDCYTIKGRWTMDNVLYTDKLIPREWIIEKYQLYKDMLFRISYSYLGNKHDCEDILQEAFIKLCYHSPDFNSAEDEKRWIIRVTINLCKNHLKSSWHRRKTNLEEAAACSIEKNVDIFHEILRLPEKYKSVIQLYYFAGYKVLEIAEFLHISEGTVKMRLKRGRERLKIELEDVK